MIDLLLFVFKPGLRPGLCSCRSLSAGVWSGSVLNGLCGVYFSQVLKKILLITKWGFVLRVQEWGIPLSTIRNMRISEYSGVKPLMMLDMEQNSSPCRDLHEGCWEKWTYSQGAEAKWIPRMIFCLQALLINRVFRGLNIFLSTRQPIL